MTDVGADDEQTVEEETCFRIFFSNLGPAGTVPARTSSGEIFCFEAYDELIRLLACERFYGPLQFVNTSL